MAKRVESQECKGRRGVYHITQCLSLSDRGTSDMPPRPPQMDMARKAESDAELIRLQNEEMERQWQKRSARAAP